MGACFSKKKESSPSSHSVAATVVVSSAPKTLENGTSGDMDYTHKAKVENAELKTKLKKEKKTVQATTTTQEDQKVEEDESGQVKKEIFVIKHRKSHDERDRNSRSPPPPQQDAPLAPHPHGLASTNEAVAESMANKASVRTSSCTKEEVDAILIQCGRLSRSSSGKAASSSASASCDRGRKYSGSKRSYDFDRCENEIIAATDDAQKKANVIENNNDLCEEDERRHHHRQRHRQSSRPSSSSQGRRRTPSREREKDQLQRSSSRERRVSRSPNRRSSETSTPASTTTANSAGNGSNNRPGKMVSVPATVSSLVMDKSNNGGGGGGGGGGESATGIKRISVKRNAGAEAGSRGAASPRSQSPARPNNQQPSLSRSSSRKAEHSPYRRNPLSEIDPNSLAYPQQHNNSSKVQNRNKKETEDSTNFLNQIPNTVVQGTNYKTSNRGTLDNQVVTVNCIPKEQLVVEEARAQPLQTGHVTTKTVVASGAESLKPQSLTRSRSSRRSRDLDLNPETLLNPTPSTYTSLLLEDIQNFHQKSINPTSVSLPPCVTKACSILEALADLNSTTSSNLSCAFSEDRKNPPTYQSNRDAYKYVAETKDPFVESEVAVTDDVMEPSFHKYVTVRRGGALVGGVDMEDQESSGSNSFVGVGQQNWGSSSSWEPNSADSTDCWTSRLNTRDEDQKSPLGFEGSSGLSEPGRHMDEARKRSSGKRRDCDHQQSGGIGRGRLGVATRGLHSTPVVAAAAST